MAFKLLVLSIVVSNTPSKINMMKQLYIAGTCGNFFLLLVYKSARQYVFSIIFIMSGPQIIHCLAAPLHERLR